MSVISNRHTVVNYVSQGAGATKALTGQRLVTACYRSKENGANRTNRAASIPMLSMVEIDSKMSVLKPLLVEYLESVQDKIFKSLLDANGIDGVVNEIADESINLDSCIAYLQDSASGERLTKESIGQWFTDSGLEDQLMLSLSTKLGISENPTDAESKKVELITNEYKAKLSAMAGGKTSYNEKMATSLQKALALIPEDSLAIKFNLRLANMIAASKEKADLFDLL